jgi:RNA polymerase sigma factor (sigma-70 family)
MNFERRSPILNHLRRIIAPIHIAQTSDGTLLQRYVTGHDEEAFAALVKRHSAMVMSVCLRVLEDVHSAEDAFQATFLVLVRKARSIAYPDCLGPWLYGVAYRTALRARSVAANRRRHERRVVFAQRANSELEVEFRDLKSILDEEIQRLPRKYRAPIIVCYFEGKTKEEAARVLGLPVGTVSSRLARAREKLRIRLTRRGLAISLGLLSCTLSQTALAGTASSSLVEATVQAGLALAAGKSLATGIISIKAVSLAEGIVKSMFLSKLKTVSVILLGATLVGSGVGVVSYRAVVAQEKKADPSQEERLRQEIGRLRNELDRLERELERLRPERAYVKVAAQREGVIVFVSTEIKEGENVPPDQRILVSVGKEIKQYRRLKIGEHVEPGQLLARVDDRLARDETTIKENKLLAVKADLVVSEKTREEAKARYETQKQLYGHKATSVEELRGAELALDKYTGEVMSKQAAVSVAVSELKLTQTVVEMHNIRSPTRGVIKGILKHPGEGVNSREAVFLIQPEE